MERLKRLRDKLRDALDTDFPAPMPGGAPYIPRWIDCTSESDGEGSGQCQASEPSPGEQPEDPPDLSRH
jgi:hypothetical protein